MDKTYQNMLFGILLFAGGMIALIILQNYLKTGYVLPPPVVEETTMRSTPMSVIPIDTPMDTDVSEHLTKHQAVGSLSTRSYTITDKVKMLWSRRKNGLNWSSCDVVNNGPDPVYISVNTSDFPEASLPAGQTITVDLKQRGSIDKIYLRCDVGKTANVDFWVVQ